MKPLLTFKTVLVCISFISLFTFKGCHQPAKSPEPLMQRKGSENPMAEMEKALQFEFNMTKDPATGRIPENIRKLELDQANALASQASIAGRVAANAYSFQGPENLGGRVRSVAYDVRFDGVLNRTILAGGISGGVFKSIDDGATWTRKSPLTDHFSCTSIAQDPRLLNQDTWYYATGESLGNSTSATGATFFGFGLYKSTNNGETWSRLTTSNTGALETFDRADDFISKVVVNPVNGDVYYACLSGIKRSTTGGTTWTSVIAPPGSFTTTFVSDIVVTSTGRLYAAFSGACSTAYDGVWTSTSGDAGSWTRIAGTGSATTPAGWDAKGAYGRVVLATTPTREDVVYALYDNLVTSSCAGVAATEAKLFKWNLATTTWTNLSANLPDEPGCLDGNDPFAIQGGYDLVISVSPTDSMAIYIGGTNAYRNTDGFKTSASNKRIGGYAGSGSYAGYAGSHADIHCFAFRPGASATMICGNDGGLQRTTDAMAAAVGWTNISTGFRTYQYYYVAIDPRLGNTKVLGGAQDNGSTRNIGGAGTSFEGVYGGDGVSVGLSDLVGGSTYEYVGSQEGDIERRNSTLGSGFATDIKPTGATEKGIFVTLFHVDEDNSEKLYYASVNQLFRTSSASTVAPGTWTELTGFPGAVGAGVNLSVLATTRGTYAATANLFAGTEDGKVYRLTNPSSVAAATAPTNITGAGFPATGYVSSISVNPRNDDTVLVTFSNYGVSSVFWTGNAKSATPTWVNVEGALTLPSYRSSAIVINGATVEYYVGTSVGLYRATISGAAPASTAWVQEGSTEMGNVVISDLALRPSDNTLIVGTHGYGIWKTSITSALPVSLTSFSGKSQKSYNALSWVVANEFNNKGYVVERRYKGENNFVEIGFVAAKGYGNNTGVNYSFDDIRSDLANPQTFYRLRQVDKDDAFKYSPVVMISRTPSFKLVEYISTNANTLLVRMNNISGEKIMVKVSDMNGRIVYRQNVSASTQQIPIGNWGPGAYITEVWLGNKREFVDKFVKQ